MAYLMFTLRYFVVSGFLEVVWSHFSELYVLALGEAPGGGLLYETDEDARRKF